MKTKTCSKCKKELPLSSFHKAKRGKFGRDQRCKPCKIEYNKSRFSINKVYWADRYQRKKTQKESGIQYDEPLTPGVKFCGKCERVKRFDEFPEDSKGIFGLNCWCKNCWNEYQRYYSAEHPDKVKLNRKKFRESIGEEEYLRRYREYNRRSGHKRRVMLRLNGDGNANIPQEYTDRLKAFNKELFQVENLCCEYCEKEIFNDEYHLDHILPVSKGGTNVITNLAISCPSCNCRKGSKSCQEFLSGIETYFAIREV